MDFWNNRRVTVTGGNGLLGKYVVRKLSERGAVVSVADQDHYDLRNLQDTRRALNDSKPRRELDTSRAKERFGFEAKTMFEEGLRRTIDWYEAAL